MTPPEYNKEVERMSVCLGRVPGAEDALVDKLLALGIISVLDLEEVGAGPLVEELHLDESLANLVVAAAAEEAKKISSDSAKKQAENLLAREQSSSD